MWNETAMEKLTYSGLPSLCASTVRECEVKRDLISAVLASLVMFCLAGLFTGVLARAFIAEHVAPAMLRTAPNLALTYAGYLLLGLLMAFAFRHVARPDQKPAVAGLKLGLLTGVVWLMPYSLVLFSVYNFPYAAIPLDFGWALVEQGLGGLVIGLVQGRRAHS